MEDKSQDLAASLEYVEVPTLDKDGNIVIKKVY